MQDAVEQNFFNGHASFDAYLVVTNLYFFLIWLWFSYLQVTQKLISIKCSINKRNHYGIYIFTKRCKSFFTNPQLFILMKINWYSIRVTCMSVYIFFPYMFLRSICKINVHFISLFIYRAIMMIVRKLNWNLQKINISLKMKNCIPLST